MLLPSSDSIHFRCVGAIVSFRLTISTSSFLCPKYSHLFPCLLMACRLLPFQRIKWFRVQLISLCSMDRGKILVYLQSVELAPASGHQGLLLNSSKRLEVAGALCREWAMLCLPEFLHHHPLEFHQWPHHQFPSQRHHRFHLMV